MIKVLRKLKGRSATELRERGAQALASLSERAGLSADAREPGDAAFYALLDDARFDGAPLSAETLLAHFRARRSPNFFPAFDAPDETRAALGERFGAERRAALVERAERIVAGRFDLLGLRGLDFGVPIDWQLEPVSGKRTPLAHWSRINYLDPSIAGDKKITWELNRQQYFEVLGRAYWHTGDERYAETFARHLGAWMDANPPKRGINWASSLEVSFRAISWLWALYFFKASPHLAPALFLRALKFLERHARHLETYLSTYFSPNTHLTGEALGLFYLGTALPEFRAAGRWRETGARILLSQLERQVRPDGVYFEQSSYYQRYTADFYTHFLLLLKAGASPREAALEEKLASLLDHLMHITLPGGRTPLFGDDDGGRLAWLDERAPDDFRSALATGAVIFRRADYKFVAREATEETLWLTGVEGLRAFDALHAQAPAHMSRAFADGGYYVMRDGWTAESNYLLLDCGPHGSLNGAHAHADALAIIACAARGRTALVDAGTCTYTGSAQLRDQFRSTAAHNTLTVDGESSSTPESAFRWGHVARSVCRVWLSRPRFDLFEGEHDGYARLRPAPAQHARGVLFIKGDYWIVRDRVETSGAHRYELNFHFAAPASVSDSASESASGSAFDSAPLETGGAMGNAGEHESDAHDLSLFAFARGGAWRRGAGLISTCYGASAPAPVHTFAFSGGAEEGVTLLVPRGAGGGDAFAVRELEALGGRALELTGDGLWDWVLLRAGGAREIETARIASDFAWAWLRFEGEDPRPRELIAIDGSFLRLDGEEVVNSPVRIGYAAARRTGNELEIETDAGNDSFIALAGAGRASGEGRRRPAPPSSDAEPREKFILNNE